MFEPERTFTLSGKPFLTIPATSQTVSLTTTAPAPNLNRFLRGSSASHINGRLRGPSASDIGEAEPASVSTYDNGTSTAAFDYYEEAEALRPMFPVPVPWVSKTEAGRCDGHCGDDG
ncbi:hypothetical protein H2201_005653 [Coniosporium apollinis]|uniref:Uncharacterized protein n=1 Tax=Coniosporium apollinis TaxID=61459 RepID=A0ABQ9NQW2_9PEZI|nr:hypothetical protein H2201_005653 [Coniosporium apollinis]